MTEEQLNYKQNVVLIKESIRSLEREFSRLRKECKHSIVKQNESATCEICAELFGWYCPVSKEHYCEYDSGPSWDVCIHCHITAERK